MLHSSEAQVETRRGYRLGRQTPYSESNESFSKISYEWTSNEDGLGLAGACRLDRPNMVNGLVRHGGGFCALPFQEDLPRLRVGSDGVEEVDL